MENNIIGKIKSLFVKSEPKKKTTPNTVAHQEPYVYLTPKGKKFHWRLDCPGLANVQQPVKMSLSKAKKAGYKACDKCCYDYLKE